MPSKIFYHATLVERLPLILERGLDPRMCEDKDEKTPCVFIDDRLNVVEAFAPGGKYSSESKKTGVILKITVPLEISDKFTYNEGEFVRARFLIESRFISVFKYTNEEGE